MGDVDAFELSPFRYDSENKKDDKMSARIITYMRVLLVVLIIAVIGVICLFIVHFNHDNEIKKELSSIIQTLNTIQQAGNVKSVGMQSFPQTIPIVKQVNTTDNIKSNVSRSVPGLYDEAIPNRHLQQNTAFEHFIKGFNLMEQNITTSFKTELVKLKSNIARNQPTSNTYELNKTRISLDALVNSVTSMENGVRQLDITHNSTLHFLTEDISSYASDVAMNIKSAAESIVKNVTKVEDRVQDIANALTELISALPKLNQSMFLMHTDRSNENAEMKKYLHNINDSVHEIDQPTSNTFELNKTRISLDALVNSVTSVENGVRQLDIMHNSTLHSLTEDISSYASDVTMNIKTAAESIVKNVTKVEDRVQAIANTLTELISALPKLNQSMFTMHTDRSNDNAEMKKYLHNINASVHEIDQMLMQSPISKDINTMRDVFETELKNIGVGQVNISGGITSILPIVERALIAILSQNETLKKVETDVTLRFDGLSKFNAVFKKALRQVNDSLLIMKEKETTHFRDSEDLLKTLFIDINSTLEIQTIKIDQNVRAIREGLLNISINTTAVSENSERNLESLVSKVNDHSDVILKNIKALLNNSNDDRRPLTAIDEQFINDLQNCQTNASKMFDSVADRQIEMLSMLQNHSMLYQDTSSYERLSLLSIRESLMNISDTIKANAGTVMYMSSSGLVRLNGNVKMTATSLAGRVEVFNEGMWGTVCDDNFGTSDAKVVCRMLGYTTGVVKSQSFYGESSIRMWLDDVACSGSECSIFDCGHAGLGVDDCSSSEEVGVICT